MNLNSLENIQNTLELEKNCELQIFYKTYHISLH